MVAGILPDEFDTSRGDELRNFMGEVAREGSGVTQGDDQMDVGDEGDGGRASEQDEQRSDEESASAANSRSFKAKARSGKLKARRKRWRERFKLVGIDGR